MRTILFLSVLCFVPLLTAQEEAKNQEKAAYKEYECAGDFSEATVASVQRVRLISGGKLLITLGSGAMTVQDLENEKELYRLHWYGKNKDTGQSEQTGRFLALSPDGTKFAAEFFADIAVPKEIPKNTRFRSLQTLRKITLLNTADGKEILKIPFQGNYVGDWVYQYNLAYHHFSPDASKFVACLFNPQTGMPVLHCWETATGKELWHSEDGTAAAKGKHSYSYGGRGTRFPLIGDFAVNPTAPFSHDGNKVLTIGSGGEKQRNIGIVRDAAAGTILCRTEIPADKQEPNMKISEFVFSPDGKSVFARCERTDGYTGKYPFCLLIWDAETGKFRREIKIEIGLEHAKPAKSTGITTAADASGKYQYAPAYEYAADGKTICLMKEAPSGMSLGMGGPTISDKNVAAPGRVTNILLIDLERERLIGEYKINPILRTNDHVPLENPLINLPDKNTAAMPLPGGNRILVLQTEDRWGAGGRGMSLYSARYIIWNIKGYAEQIIEVPAYANTKVGVQGSSMSVPDICPLAYFCYKGSPGGGRPFASQGTWCFVFDIESILKAEPVLPPLLSKAVADADFSADFTERELADFVLYSTKASRDFYVEMPANRASNGSNHENHRVKLTEDHEKIRLSGFHMLQPYQVLETKETAVILHVPLPFRSRIPKNSEDGNVSFTQELAGLKLAGLDENISVHNSDTGQNDFVTKNAAMQGFLRSPNGDLVPLLQSQTKKYAENNDPNLYYKENTAEQTGLRVELTGTPETIKQITEQPEKFAVQVLLTDLHLNSLDGVGYFQRNALQELKSAKAVRQKQEAEPHLAPPVYIVEKPTGILSEPRRVCADVIDMQITEKQNAGNK